ncbi:tetratricopeptide repeat protein 16-like [Myripristis murdjan]|uniref:tetratricopeptide repeat protein 16-like n=1 Tax=Myripristis murdjan TaxID=586833 RepID=UPI001175C92F|nr:tetratricopeptide repeat protein 16 [Myripristis murdjan]
MENSPDRNDQQQLAEQHSVFSPAVVEEALEEARPESTFHRLLVSSKISQTPAEKPPERPDLQANLIIQKKALEHYSSGKKAMERFQYEKAVICFSKAMNLEPKQTQLHVSQAEAYLQLCDFQSAVASYKQACLLEPGAFNNRLAFIYYLQGQCLFDRGLFIEALESFTKAAELKPGSRVYQMRSLACLSAMGCYSECVKLLNDWIASWDSPNADLYTMRARLHQQLHQMVLCYHDVKSALALNPVCPQASALLLQLQERAEKARQEAVNRALSGRLPDALTKINTALQHCPQDGHLYLFRGTLYRRLKDFTAAIEDLVLAVELSEKQEEEEEEGRVQAELSGNQEDRWSVEARAQLVLTYNDFAVECFGRGLYSEAILLLNKAIEEEKGKGGLYLNRGDCFFKQGEWVFALADYQQAEEMMKPEEPAVRLRLAILHNTLGSQSFQEGRFQEAADSFSLAIHYNPRASQYYHSRAKAFNKLLNLQGAKHDLISTLILEPTNEEVLPLLLSLFPGCSVSDVVSSLMGQEIRAKLTDILSCCSSSEQQRLCKELEKITLTSEITDSQPASQSEGASEPEKEVKPC